VGISKPNPKLYQRACAAMGLDPHQGMYIGDSPLHDVDPVNSLGMISVRTHRDNRFEGLQGKTVPRFEIRSFEDLVPILGEEFGITLPA
jgi:FMN phosphatase YigB (HAD superfamily)